MCTIASFCQNDSPGRSTRGARSDVYDCFVYSERFLQRPSSADIVLRLNACTTCSVVNTVLIMVITIYHEAYIRIIWHKTDDNLGLRVKFWGGIRLS